MAISAGTLGQDGNRIDLSARLEEWRRQLLDTSKRSRLVNSKFGRGGVLAIEHPGFEYLWEELAVKGQSLEFPWPSQWIDIDETDHADSDVEAQNRGSKGILSSAQIEIIKGALPQAGSFVLTNLGDRLLDGRLKRLSINASTSLSEQGVNSLFLAFGFLRWFESADSDVALLAPLVLLPVSLRKQSADSTWVLTPLDDELSSNHPLAEVLRADFRLNIPQFAEEELQESTEALNAYFAEVQQAISHHERWQVQRTAGLATFAFQKISMWEDLRRNEAQIVSHPLCRGIAGDSSLMPASNASAIFESELDDVVAPETSYLVRDCDSSQLAAIEVVQQGHNLILDGPPGTGKSQTITNIISRCLANNKTVLFVSEKAAALEVVKGRLDAARLGDFCLECHSHKANKRAVVEELGRCLNRQHENYPSQDHKATELRRTRQKLNEYVRALHVKRSALNLTPFNVHGHLAKIGKTSASRVIVPNAHSVDRNRLQAMEEAVAYLANSVGIIEAKSVHPWRGLRTGLNRLTLSDDVRFHFDRASKALRTIQEAVRSLVEFGFLCESPTRTDLATAVKSVSSILLYPRIPGSWVAAGLATTAERFIAIHELSENYRILSSSVSGYTGAAQGKQHQLVVTAIVNSATKLRAFLPDLPSPARKRAAFVESAGVQSQAIIDLVEELEGAVNLLRQLLRVQETQLTTVADAADVASKVLMISSLVRARPQWFDGSNRKRLRQIASDLKEVAAMATAMQAGLELKFLPLAFLPVAMEQVEDLLRHQSWISRFGGSWRRAKQNFCSLYRAAPPAKSRELIDDAYQLRRFQQYLAQLRTTKTQDREDLQWDGSLTFNWDSVIVPLDAISSLPADLQSGETARSVAELLESTSRTSIISAATRTRTLGEKLISKISEAAESTEKLAIFGSSTVDDLTLATIKSRASEVRNVCQAHFADLKALFPFIRDDRDVAVEGLEKDLDVLIEIRSLANQARGIATELGDILTVTKPQSIGGLKARADLSQWVISFQKQYAGSPPAHIIQAICNDDIHATLASAVAKVNLTDDLAVRSSLDFLESLFIQTDVVSTGVVLAQLSIADLAEWLAERVRDADRIGEWVSYANACEDLRRAGLQTLLDEILDGSVQTSECVDVLRQRFYRLWLDEAYSAERALGDFDLSQHEQTLARFREVDRFWIANGFAQVRSKVLANTTRVNSLGGQAPEGSELGILLREMNKKRRHLPLRRLFASTSSLLLKLKPCIMMSPLAVSTYFDKSNIRFDVVIFDEASQVRPHDAICAIYRGSQLIVAGDQKQLPPTNFFERLGDDDAEDDEELAHSSSDYESILDVCATLRLPRQRLKWHYRSKRESLIAFSNRHFYDGELVTFPSVRDVDGSSGVAFHFVENGRWAGSMNQKEAEEIADAVMRHAAEQSEKSLGVITMNQPQQMLVLEMIENRRRAALHLEQFFSADKPDPFFVKNLENVQGDERDVIFLGVGYAKNDAGTLNHGFYPLNRSGGERRLNVAVTRAREALTVFTSIRAGDIDLARARAQGPKLLRAYLDFAERGTVALAATETADGEQDFDSDFEIEVARALANRGLDVRHQIGCSGFKIDLAIVHPAHPGKYVLGVECDGATYHSSATARDRDRLRQDVLEGLGWRICRIWSTDWIRDPRRQIEKVLEVYRKALSAVDLNHAATNGVEVLAPVQSLNETEPPLVWPAMQFSAIEDVPSGIIRHLLIETIRSFGATPPDDLMQTATRKLGFQRTGSRIRDRMSDELRRLEQNGELVADGDGRLRLRAETV